jgi:hypothetical protein
MTTGRLQYGTDKKKQDEEFKKEVDKYRREMQKREKYEVFVSFTREILFTCTIFFGIVFFFDSFHNDQAE